MTSKRAIGFLPGISAVHAGRGQTVLPLEIGTPEASDNDDDARTFSYVPIESLPGSNHRSPDCNCRNACRGLLSIWRPTTFHSYEGVFPDPYALKQTKADKFAAAAVLPAIGPVPEGQPRDRVRYMAERLKGTRAEARVDPVCLLDPGLALGEECLFR